MSLHFLGTKPQNQYLSYVQYSASTIHAFVWLLYGYQYFHQPLLTKIFYFPTEQERIRNYELCFCHKYKFNTTKEKLVAKGIKEKCNSHMKMVEEDL